MKMVGLFIDAQNLYHVIEKVHGKDQKLCYRKYKNYILDTLTDVCLSRTIAYGVQEDATKFIDVLLHNGIEIKYHTRMLNDVINMILDIIRMIRKLNVVILGTNNPYLSLLVDWIKEQGCECYIFACDIPKELKQNCNKWVEIPSDLLI